MTPTSTTTFKFSSPVKNTKKKKEVLKMTTTSYSTLNNNILGRSSSIISNSNSSRSKLIITILSMHELPVRYDNMLLEPQSVMLETLDQILEIGPPISRHKHKQNDYRFTTSNKESLSSSYNNNNNEFVIFTPLSSLYKSILKFTVVLVSSSASIATSLEDSSKKEVNICNLISKESKVSDIALINETKCSILPLRYNKKFIDNRDENNNKDGATTKSVSKTKSTSLDNIVKPTLRINIRLETEAYRPEIAFILYICITWFHVIDYIYPYLESICYYFLVDIPSKYPSTIMLFLIPLIPLLGLIISSLPIIIGLLLIFGFPIFLTLLMIIGFLLSSSTLIMGILYCSTKNIRMYLSNTIQSPIFTTFLSSSIGQQLLYKTGPRPTPKYILRTFLSNNNNNMLQKLFISLLIDSIGSSTYLLPIVGESFDIIWAPIQYYCISILYNTSTPVSFKYVSFIEELLPFTDILPSATIGWLWEHCYYNNTNSSPLRLGSGCNNNKLKGSKNNNGNVLKEDKY